MFQSIETFFDAIYVINLQKRRLRWEESIKLLSQYGIFNKIKKFTAIDCGFDDPQLNGRCGCALSHIGCMKDAVQNGFKRILVLEDDFSILLNSTDFGENFNRILEHAPDSYDILYLGGNVTNLVSFNPLKNYNKYFYKVAGCASTHAVSYSHRFCEFMTSLDLNRKNIKDWIIKNEAIDVYYALTVQVQNNCFISNPQVFGQRKSFSDIEMSTTDYYQQLNDKFQYFRNFSSKKPIPVLDNNFPPNHVFLPHDSLNGVEFYKARGLFDLENEKKLIVTDAHLNNDSLQQIHKVFDGDLYAWLVEPSCINPLAHEFIINNYRKFKNVFSAFHDLKHQIENFQYVPVSSCWLKESSQRIWEKTDNVSMVLSDKSFAVGHQFRKSCFDAIKGLLDGIKGPERRVHEIDEFIVPYRFSVVVENCKERGYFTEKIVNCLRCGTIPIYWGDPNVNRVFNGQGIIEFNNLQELFSIIFKLSESEYQSRLNAVEENFQIAEIYIREHWGMALQNF